MNKIFTLIVLLILVFSLPARNVHAGSSPKCTASDDVQISNPYLVLSVFDGTGNINLETTDGKLLLFPGDTSSMTFRVDETSEKTGEDLNLYMTQEPTIVAADTVVVKWKMDGISLEVEYKLTGDNLQLTATMTNEDTVFHQVGIRFLLDTQLGPNDGAPLYVPNIGVKTYETNLPSPTFDYWMAYDFYPDPSMQAYGTFINFPDRVVFAWWPEANHSLWDYTSDPDQRFYTPGYTTTPESDSCVLMYFDPLLLDPTDSRTIVFSYGLSLSLESWKSSMISSLDASQSYLLNILSSSINSYANMMLKFNSLGVDHNIIIFEEPDPDDDWWRYDDFRRNVESLSWITKIGSLLRASDQLALENMNPDLLTTVPRQIWSAITDPSNGHKWGWVSRKLDYGGAPVLGAVLSITQVVIKAFRQLQVEDVWNKLNAFNEALAAVYDSIMNAPLDIATITNSLYSAFGNDIMSQIKSLHDASVQCIQDLVLPEGVNPDYFLDVLRGINAELSQAYAHQRNVIIVGDEQYFLPDMNSLQGTVETIYEHIVLADDIAFYAGVVGTAAGVGSYLLAPTGFGGVACRIASLVASVVGVITKYIAFKMEQALFSAMILGSTSVFDLAYSLPMISSEINILAASYLSSPVQHESGNIADVNVRNEWNLGTFHFDTFFDTTIHNSAPVTSSGFIVFHVRSIDQDLNLADMNSYGLTVGADETLTFTLISMVHFSWWGGNYEGRLELWLGPLKVAWETVQYNVGIGGGIESTTVMQGNIGPGRSQSGTYDSSGYDLPSTLTLNYGGSEVNLHAYDSFGRHLGIDYSTGLIDTEIPEAQYSGPLPSIEWAILPPNVYTLEVVCISAEPDGEDFSVVATEFLPSPGILDVTPKSIEGTADPETIFDVSLIIAEIGSQNGLTDVKITLSNLQGPQSTMIQPSEQPAGFDLQPGETKTVNLHYTVPAGAPTGNFSGTIEISATGLSSDGPPQSYEQQIPVIAVVSDGGQPITPFPLHLVGIGIGLAVVAIAAVSIMILLRKPRPVEERKTSTQVIAIPGSYCNICRLVLKESDRALQCPSCKAIFHEGCLLAWIELNGTCPACSQIVRTPESDSA